MIITAGKFKGRKIKTVKSSAVRPTSSKIRESIFSITQLSPGGTIFYEDETNFLDLFAGSGIMGLEAISRGAKRAVFVEKSSDTVKILRQNLTIAGEDARLVVGDAVKVLDRFEEGEFNFIFVDPPYHAGLYEPVLKKISRILAPNGVIILEHDSKLDLVPAAENFGFKVYKTKIYGDTGITVLLRA